MKKIIQVMGIVLLVATYASADNIYSHLSTIELQKKVESLSKSGNLPFLMGIELLNRWSHTS